MADANWGLIILVIAVVLINIVGLGLCTSRRSKSDKKRVKELEGQLAEVHKELDGYKAQVNEHFMKTSVLLSQMTDSYRAVFTHLAEGSQNLSNSDAARLKASDSGFASLTHEAETAVEEPETAVEQPESLESSEIAEDKKVIVDEEEDQSSTSKESSETPETPDEPEHEIVLEEQVESPVEPEQETVAEESEEVSEMPEQNVVIEEPVEVEIPEGPEWETSHEDFTQDDTEAASVEEDEISADEVDTQEKKER